jgi:hypothetical protein
VLVLSPITIAGTLAAELWLHISKEEGDHPRATVENRHKIVPGILLLRSSAVIDRLHMQFYPLMGQIGDLQAAAVGVLEKKGPWVSPNKHLKKKLKKNRLPT